MNKLFTCEDCGQKLPIEEFTNCYICKACYDRSYEEYCAWVEQQYELQQMNQLEELQIEGM